MQAAISCGSFEIRQIRRAVPPERVLHVQTRTMGKSERTRGKEKDERKKEGRKRGETEREREGQKSGRAKVSYMYGRLHTRR